MMDKELRILIASDSPGDAERMENALNRSGISFHSRLARDEASFVAEILAAEPDIILSDYEIAGFSGISALEIARERIPHTPFVFVAETIGEETVVDLLKRGATDYVLTNHLSPRLPTAVRRAIRDVRERAIRVETERQLRENEERFRCLSASSPVGIFLTDIEGDWIYANPRCRRLWSLSLRDIMGKGWLAAVTGEDRAGLTEKWEASVRDDRDFSAEFRLAQADGAVCCVAARAAVMLSDTGVVAGHVGTVEDITNRKLAEQRIAIQYAVTRVLAESDAWDAAAPDVLQTICKELGLPLGQRWQADRLENLIRKIDGWQEPELDSSEFVRQSRDLVFERGQSIPGRVWVDGQPAWIDEIEMSPGFLHGRAASEIGLRSAVAVPILIQGEVAEVLIFFGRTSLRRHDRELLEVMRGLCTQIGQFIERKRIEQQFLQAQKMEAFGKLAGGIAHDFNNLLTVIAGYSEIVCHELNPDDRCRGFVEEISRAAERATALTGQLLAFTRQQVLKPRLLDLNEVIAEVSKMLRRLIGADVTLITVRGDNLGSVKADPGQLEQVIINLAVNARDAMPEGGILRIETSNVRLNASDEQAGGLDGDYVLMTVADNGVGMSSGVREQIFEPFFTTKSVGNGTGLGLATCHGIISQSNGRIEVESTPGIGTAFRIYLPRVDEPSEHLASVPESDELPGGSETVLVVESDQPVRQFTTSFLSGLGYEVLDAGGGDAAYSIVLERIGRPLHLVITDIVIPQKSGRELALLVRAMHPETRVLFVSGDPTHDLDQPGMMLPTDGFMPKPLLPRKLAIQVREILDRQAK